LRAKEVVLTLLSLGGVVLVARPTFLFGASSHALDPVVVAVALGGAVFSAAAYVVVRRLKGERAMVVVFYFATLSVLGALPPSVVVWVRPDWIGWVVLLGVGVTTYLGQLFLTMGLQRERAGRATSIGYLQVVFAALWGALFFGEIPDGWSVVGAALILGSTYLVARGPAERVGVV
jgi:drug/metabolite transporter (DMT)-like permease